MTPPASFSKRPARAFFSSSASILASTHARDASGSSIRVSPESRRARRCSRRAIFLANTFPRSYPNIPSVPSTATVTSTCAPHHNPVRTIAYQPHVRSHAAILMVSPPVPAWWDSGIHVGHGSGTWEVTLGDQVRAGGSEAGGEGGPGRWWLRRGPAGVPAARPVVHVPLASWERLGPAAHEL
jgi:hypothetical protein